MQSKGDGKQRWHRFAEPGIGYVSLMTESDRATSRADKQLPEEKAAGGDNPLRQAEVILDESDQRQEDRNASPSTHLEHRHSEDTVPPTD